MGIIMKKRILSGLLAFSLAVAALFSFQTTALYAATPASGTCGSSASYTFDSATHTLTITGNGAIKDYGVTALNRVPWYDDRGTITNVVIEGNITTIGTRAFYQMTALESVTITSPLETINSYAFSESPNLTSITIPSTTTTISTGAFKACTGLTSVIFNEGLTTIEAMAFDGCTSLTSVTFPNSLTTIGGLAETGAFQNCTSLATVTYGTGMTSTGKGTFLNSGVKTINFSSTITTIDEWCFKECKLNVLVIPEQVTAINTRAFANNYNLTEATILNSECTFNGIVGEDPFNGSQQSLVIKGHSHSTAQTYAEEKGYTFVTIDECAHETTVENVIKEATCTETGEIQYVCTLCGEVAKTVITDALGHDFVTVEESDMTAVDGHSYQYQACSRCSEENTIATHNEWVEGYYTDVSTATCTKTGTLTRTCDICGKKTYSIAPKTNHQVEEYTSIAEPTCTVDGSKTGTCVVCGELVTVTLPATGHTEELISSSATDDGHTNNSYKCTVCGEEREECVHDEWLEGYYTVDHVSAATCLSSGSDEYVCTVCGLVEERTISATGHSYDEGVVTKEPTCTETGTTTYTCTNPGCTSSYGVPIQSLGHSYGEEVIEKAATCTEMGTASKTCTRCNFRTSYSIAALGHTVQDAEDYALITPPTCTEAGVEGGTCTRCNTYQELSVEALGHEFDTENAVITTAPTCEDAGVATAKCIRCTETTEVSVPATGHDYHFNSVVQTTLGVSVTYTCSVCATQTSKLQSVVTTSFMLYLNSSASTVTNGYLYDVNNDGYITIRDYSILMGYCVQRCSE